MAKIWGLDIPIEFQAGFSEVVKLDWFNDQQRATLNVNEPAKLKCQRIGGRSYLPDFLDDWQALSEEQQTKWLKDWGSGGEQAFALFFQNNYWRMVNSLALRTTPNFFTAPAAWLHIAENDTSVILNFQINNGDDILSDPANILHIQNPLTCIFTKSNTINIKLSAKLKNIISTSSPTCTIKITQYISVIVSTYSREFEFEPIAISGNELLIDINHTFQTLEGYEWAINYKIEFKFENVAGDFWFYEGLITAIDSVLGVVRLHNVNNLQDVGKVFSGHLQYVLNQWSLSDNESETTLRRVFPYAFGYPEEEENTELILNGNFDTNLGNWDVGDGWLWDNGTANNHGRYTTLGQEILNITPTKTYNLEFDILDGNNGLFYFWIGDPDEEVWFEFYDTIANGHHSYTITATTAWNYLEFLGQGWNGKIDNISLTEI